MAVGGADPPIRHPLHEILERDVDVAREVHPASGLGQCIVERLGLDVRAGEAVEDRAAGRVGRLESIEEDADDGLVRDELATTHVSVRLAPERRVLRDRRPQEVAGGQHGDVESLRHRRCLGALSCPGCPEQDEYSHATAIIG